MIPVGKLLLSAFTSVTLFGLWKVFQFVYEQQTSPLRHLRGPKGTSWIYGNMQEIWKAENSVLQEQWVKQYGNTLKYKGLFYKDRLFTMDTRALNHVFAHSSDYHKPSHVRHDLSKIFGKGLIFSEGAEHRQQRRVMNPAFGPAQIRALTDIIHEKAIQLRDALTSEIAKDSVVSTTGARLDILAWLNKMTLDVIGLAGFNYNFDAINPNEKPNELYEAYTTMFAPGRMQGMFITLQAWFPPLRLVPTERAHNLEVAQRRVGRVSKELLSDAKAAALESATEKGEIEKGNLRGRDLLSLLVKANMATDIPESQKLSDEDVKAQVPTFLIAGHETTSIATTWALYAMTTKPEIQTKLREELLAVDTETPSMDELMALPFLDAVVKETLRVHPPIPSVERVAMKDDVLPVAKPYTDKNGVVHDSIRVRKGDPIFISMLAVNRSQELWGPDAREFKPERWENIPEAVSQVPGVWSHMMTFISGPRACIGYRFALVEMKVMLFVLLRAFEFELAVPASEIGNKLTIIPVQRPILVHDPEGGAQLPLLVKPYKQA